MIKKEDKKEETNSGTGYEDGQYILLFSTTARFCDMKQMMKLLTLIFSFDYN